jgi:hypothetical protein
MSRRYATRTKHIVLTGPTAVFVGNVSEPLDKDRALALAREHGQLAKHYIKPNEPWMILTFVTHEAASGFYDSMGQARHRVEIQTAGENPTPVQVRKPFAEWARRQGKR